MDTQPIRSLERLIYEHEQKYRDSHFFDRGTLKFFGERRSEMRLLQTTEKVTAPSGDTHICYVVSSKQWKHPKGPRRVYHYFDVNTLQHVIKEERL